MTNDQNIQAAPCCPRCQSFDVAPVSKRTLILTGIGGLLGAVIMVFLTLSGKPRNKSGAVASIVFGALSGASVGLSFGKSGHNTEEPQDYLCLNCFHVFTHNKQSIS